jgi:V-type H+-transporting ATPase subunit C
LKEQLEGKTSLLNDTARSCYQQTFAALMHLKVVRAYIDGVLRFGIPPRFYLGIVFPKKGSERQVLLDMTDALAEPMLKEMYGEKLDASEAEDFWPFVSVPRTSPQFMHVNQ